MATGESRTANRPFQFTLTQMAVAFVCVCLILALTKQLGAVGISLSFFATSFFLIYIGAHKKCLKWTASGFVAILVGVWLLLLQAVHDPREVARRSACRNNLRQIALALMQYHDDFSAYPPAIVFDDNGKPMHSWRVLLLPYLDQKNLYQQYRLDEPWDGPNNSKLHSEFLKIYACPSRSEEQPRTDTTYVAVLGPKTIWPTDRNPSRIADVTDGLSNTLLIVETHNSGIHWMEPRDLHLNQMPMVINPSRGQGISSGHKEGANVVCADCSVRFFSNRVLPEILRATLTRSNREFVDLSQ
jgi:hypothetical protein